MKNSLFALAELRKGRLVKLLPAGFLQLSSQAKARSVKKPRGATASMAFAIIYVLNEVKNDGKMAVA